MSRPVEQQTLRELFNNGEQLTKELIDHIQRAFLPRVHELNEIVRPSKAGIYGGKAKNVTVRHHVAQVLDSEKFSNDVYQNLEQHCQAILDSTSSIVE